MSEGSARADRSTVLAAFDGPGPVTTGEVADAVGSDPGAVETTLSALVEDGEIGHRSLAVEGSEVDLWYPTGESDRGDTVRETSDPDDTVRETSDPDDTGQETSDPDDTEIDHRSERDGFEWVDDAGGVPGETHVGGVPEGSDAGSVAGESDPQGPADTWSADEVTVRGDADASLSGGGEDATPPDGSDARIEAAIEDLEVPGTSEMMRDWRRNAVRAAFDHLQECESVSANEIREATYPSNRAGYEDPETWWSFVAPRLADLPGVERDGEEWSFDGQD